jgi:hypothetical protein
MSSITSKLPKLLRGVNRSGDFYVTGTAEFFAPQLEVEDIGVISLPLLPPQAKQLLEAAERAPRGRRTGSASAGRAAAGSKACNRSSNGRPKDSA